MSPGVTPDLLTAGEMTLLGRIRPASNVAYLVEVKHGERAQRCIYKPVRGERPLWDFPHGTLAGREYVAFLVSEVLGWGVVPPTTLRDGDAGPGMVQAWQEVDPLGGPVDVVSRRQVPRGWHVVVEATDQLGRPVLLVHADRPDLRRIAVFDAVINNGDRKGGHILPLLDGSLCGIDHGVSFHEEDKLRTVLWGWSGAPLTDDEREGVRRVRAASSDSCSPLAEAMRAHLTAAEIRALFERCDALVRHRTMPAPSGHWPAIPWPPF